MIPFRASRKATWIYEPDCEQRSAVVCNQWFRQRRNGRHPGEYTYAEHYLDGQKIGLQTSGALTLFRQIAILLKIFS
jgi:hypothetical protein